SDWSSDVCSSDLDLNDQTIVVRSLFWRGHIHHRRRQSEGGCGSIRRRDWMRIQRHVCDRQAIQWIGDSTPPCRGTRTLDDRLLAKQELPEIQYADQDQEKDERDECQLHQDTATGGLTPRTFADRDVRHKGVQMP